MYIWLPVDLRVVASVFLYFFFVEDKFVVLGGGGNFGYDVCCCYHGMIWYYSTIVFSGHCCWCLLFCNGDCNWHGDVWCLVLVIVAVCILDLHLL